MPDVAARADAEDGVQLLSCVDPDHHVRHQHTPRRFGLIGVVLTGAFSSLVVNAAGEAGGLTQLGRQCVLAIAGVVYPFVMTWLILLVTDKLVGLKVTEADEEAGLDIAEHGESGYDWSHPLPAMAIAAAAGNGGDPEQIAVQAAD